MRAICLRRLAGSGLGILVLMIASAQGAAAGFIPPIGPSTLLGHQHSDSANTASNESQHIVVNANCRTGAAAVQSAAAGRGEPLLGQVPYDFTATTVDCKTATLSQYTKGHVAYLNFYATWCGPCNDEGPDVAKFFDEHAPDGLVALAVLTGDKGTSGYDPRGPVAFYKKYGYHFESVWDDTNTIGAAYNINFIPTTVWLHADGTIAMVYVGSETPDVLESNYACAVESSADEQNDTNCMSTYVVNGVY